jgi:hypothetical protein
MSNSTRYLFLVALVFLTIVSAREVYAQNVVEVRRDQLTLLPNIAQAGRVQWSLDSSGTRRENVRCTIENGFEFRQSNDQIVFRLTDSGGLMNDPACDFNLSFVNLKNSFVFESVSMDDPVVCGNEPCSTGITRTNNPGDHSFNVRVRLKMKGIASWLPSTRNKRTAVVRVRLKLSSPPDRAIFSPFVQAFIPDLYVSNIKPGLSLSDKVCKVGVTIVNTGESSWEFAQTHAYDSLILGTDRRVRVTLKRNGQQCGVAEMSLRDFDPARSLTRTDSPVTRVWPGCSFRPGPPDTFTVTVDSSSQLVEQSETNKTKTIEQSCLPWPPSSPVHP